MTNNKNSFTSPLVEAVKSVKPHLRNNLDAVIMTAFREKPILEELLSLVADMDASGIFESGIITRALQHYIKTATDQKEKDEAFHALTEMDHLMRVLTNNSDSIPVLQALVTQSMPEIEYETSEMFEQTEQD